MKNAHIHVGFTTGVQPYVGQRAAVPLQGLALL